MSAEAKIRAALAAGPLEGPWFAERDFSQWRISNFQEAKNGSPRRVAGVGSPGRLKTSKLEQENARTAAFIAACNPAAMTELLAELDRLRAEMAGVLNAGAQLSNCAFNLAQRDPGEFTQRDADALDRARKDWDAARTPKEPGCDLQARTVGGGAT